jgi:N-acetylglucosamine-6-phosphate deacetylase
MPEGAFDLQVNGYAGVDFNAGPPAPEALHAVCARCVREGVAGILATLISDDLETMAGRLQALAAARDQDPLAREVIAGVHLEGPFLNPQDGYRGAHHAAALRPGNPDIMRRLLDAGGGLVRLVTLAPECDPDLGVTRLLVRAGIAVSAGHTDASLDCLRAACDEGLRMFTHLGNGCPAVGMNRHDNIIQRALSLQDRIWCAFIADGAHVPFFALGNYLRAAGLDRCLIVSDATAAAGLGPGAYQLGPVPFIVDEHLVAWAPDRSHLLGSATGLAASAGRLQRALALSDAEREMLTSVNPRAVLAGRS